MQEVQCRIYGRTQNGRNIEIVQNTRVPPGETQLVRLSIGELGEGSYRFEAKGISPMEFQDSTQLQYLSKGYSVFIQTDKAIYRPGNEVWLYIRDLGFCSENPSGSVQSHCPLTEVKTQCYWFHRHHNV